MKRSTILLLALILSTLATGQAQKKGRILKLEELTYTDNDAIDRTKSVFLLTFGNLEEHGPHIPVGSDYFQAVGVRDRLIDRLRAAHPDYDFVTVPVVPLGECGANHMARQFEHIGTFGVRYETLRDVAIDLGRAIAQKRFQNIFIIHFHGCPLHNAALTEAAAFVSERYKVRMINVTTSARASLKGEFFNPSVLEKHLGKGWEERIGFEGHAGAAETSTNLPAAPAAIITRRG